MKIWLINNTKFAYNNSDESFNIAYSYFKDYFIPTIQKYSKPSDIVVHLGNVFHNSTLIKTSNLIKIKMLFEEISDIIPLYMMVNKNDKDIHYFFNHKNIKILPDFYKESNILFISNNFIDHISNINNNDIIITNCKIDIEILKSYPNLIMQGYYDYNSINENIIRLGTPYELTKNISNCGIYVLNNKNKEYKFIKNTFSPIYKIITINELSDIDKLDKDEINNNFVNLVINSNLVNEKSVKLDYLLSKFKFKNVSYSDSTKVESIIENETMNIENLVIDKIKNNKKVLDEFNNIVRIYKEKY